MNTRPSTSLAATGRLSPGFPTPQWQMPRPKRIGPVALNVPVAGSNSSADAGAVAEPWASHDPPAMRTRPSSSSVAVVFSRAVVIRPVAENRPVAGSQSSALASIPVGHSPVTGSRGPSGPIAVPPTISTRPSRRRTAACRVRGVSIAAGLGDADRDRLGARSGVSPRRRDRSVVARPRSAPSAARDSRPTMAPTSAARSKQPEDDRHEPRAEPGARPSAPRAAPDPRPPSRRPRPLHVDRHPVGVATEGLGEARLERVRVSHGRGPSADVR